MGNGDAIQSTDVSDLQAGPITHARAAATGAVVERGQQSPKWLGCMFSQVDANIVICNPQPLPGPEAAIRMPDCRWVIVKALKEGDHHALLLKARHIDHAKASKPGPWPEAASRPIEHEVHLAVRTAEYHWVRAFQDLWWRVKPDCQISRTHWQDWLQADAQRHHPPPRTRAHCSADTRIIGSSRTVAPHTVLLTYLPFALAPESCICKLVALPPATGATEPTK